MLIVSFL